MEKNELCTQYKERFAQSVTLTEKNTAGRAHNNRTMGLMNDTIKRTIDAIKWLLESDAGAIWA